jgi:hypothetical protein
LPFDGNDVSCLSCGNVKEGASNNDDLHANLMGHGPSCDCKDCISFRYEAEMSRQRELLRKG